MKFLVEGVSKTFGNHRVLDGIALCFDAVQTLVLIGPSGGGKSTLLRILAGLEYPDRTGEYRVEIDGKPVVYGGQRQRVAIARAIAIKPRLLFFDEPTSALDPEMTAGVLEVIEELRDEGRDFVLVTHEMGFARRVADQVALLAEGRIVESGPAAQVFDAPAQEVSRNFFARVLKY